MEKLKFTTTKMHNKEILLEMVGDRLHIVYGNLFDYIDGERLLSPKETQYEISRFQNLHLSLWDHHYGEETSGESWRLELDDDVYQGQGAYPDNYQDFISLLDELVPEAGLIDPDQIVEALIISNDESLRLNVSQQEIAYCRSSKNKTSFEIHDAMLLDSLFSVIEEHNAHVYLKSMITSHCVQVTIAHGESFIYDYDASALRDLMHDLTHLLTSYFNELPLFIQ